MECYKCGNCCKQITFKCPLPDELAEFMSVTFERPIKAVAVRVKHKCRHLTEENLCRIYENRPAYCRKFRCQDPMELIVTGVPA